MTKLRLACLSPLPPDRSGVATYSRLLFEALREKVDLVLFHNQPETVAVDLKSQFTVRSINSFKGQLAEQFDLCWYQMGNNIQYHRTIYETAVQHPGVITLHDLNLHAFYGEHYLKTDRFAAYSGEMGFAYGLEGVNHARQAYFDKQPYNGEKYPLFTRLAQGQLGLVVHNDYSYQQVLESGAKTAVQKIPLHQPLYDSLPETAAAKEGLGFQSSDILLASFGYLAPAKRIESALNVLAQLLPSHPNLHYVLVGKQVDGYSLHPLIDQLGIGEHVHFAGYVDDVAYQTYLAATDIGINLRYPSRGETSATLLSLLAAGKPTIVTDSGSFSELPNNICIKIAHDASELAALVESMQHLVAQPEERKLLGEAAQHYIADVCAPETVSMHYLAFFEELLLGNLPE